MHYGNRDKGINTYTFTLYKNHHGNTYIYICIICSQNYASKCAIKYITIVYMSKLLKLLFSKIYIFFVLVYLKMAQENIRFYEYNERSYNMVDLYLYDTFYGYKDYYNYYDIDFDNILLFKKVIMNTVLDITM